MMVLSKKLEGKYMKLSGPKEVFDFDTVLPLDGEDRFDLCYSERQVVLSVFYCTEFDDLAEQKIVIRFDGAKYFFKMPFPGRSIFICSDDEEVRLINSLVVYDYSEMIAADMRDASVSLYKQYRLFLHSVGVAIYVVAESCVVV